MVVRQATNSRCLLIVFAKQQFQHLFRVFQEAPRHLVMLRLLVIHAVYPLAKKLGLALIVYIEDKSKGGADGVLQEQ